MDASKTDGREAGRDVNITGLVASGGPATEWTGEREEVRIWHSTTVLALGRLVEALNNSKFRDLMRLGSSCELLSFYPGSLSFSFLLFFHTKK